MHNKCREELERVKTEGKFEDLHDLKKRLLCCMNDALAKGVDQVSANELGEVSDIIKDLAETEKLCLEACYYKTVIEAMGEEDEEEERYGYRPRPRLHLRYPRHKPMVDQMPYVEDYLENKDIGMERNMRLGYDPDRRMQRRSSETGRYKDDGDTMRDNRYGQAYNEYTQSRRHYTMTNSAADKDEMSVHAQQHIADTMTTIRDIWKTADPELRKRMKADLTALVNELTV